MSLVSIPEMDTSKVTNMSYIFATSSNITDIPVMNAGKVINLYRAFYNCYGLTNFEGLVNLGKGYTKQTANYSNYALDLSACANLTYDSLVNIINNLYDLNLAYNVANGGTLYTQSLVLGATNLAKLTADEINVAVQKGWSVS
jgi:hypothetical protein